MKQYRLIIKRDDFTENPVTSWDWPGIHLLVAHKNFDFGHKNFRHVDALVTYQTELISGKKHDIFPVFAYDHSGVVVSLSPFSCKWDSGRIGSIIVLKEDDSADVDTLKQAQGLVDTLNQYLSGDVWLYRVESVDLVDGDVEYLDGCCGIYAEEEAKKMGEEVLKQYQQEAEKQLDLSGLDRLLERLHELAKKLAPETKLEEGHISERIARLAFIEAAANKKEKT